MSATVFSLPSAVSPPQRPNNLSSPEAAAAAASTGRSPSHQLAGVLHTVRVYVVSAFEVAILGEYAEEADKRHR